MKFAKLRLEVSQNNLSDFVFESIIAENLTICSKTMSKTLLIRISRFAGFFWIELKICKSYWCKWFGQFQVCLWLRLICCLILFLKRQAWLDKPARLSFSCSLDLPLHLRLDRCTLACLERRELLLLPPHILHHRCARELLCCCASFLLLLLLVCLKLFVSMEKKNVNDKLCSPAAPGSSPGGDSGKSRSSSRA